MFFNPFHQGIEELFFIEIVCACPDAGTDGPIYAPNICNMNSDEGLNQKLNAANAASTAMVMDTSF